MPFPGVITALRAPSGSGVRFDTGIAQGSVVSDQFDSLLAKLVVYAPTRQECITRARRALNELRIEGTPTVIPFAQAVLGSEDFTAPDGQLRVYTRWIEEVFLKRIDATSLVSTSPSVRAPAQLVTRTWIEVDGRRVELGIPDSLKLGTATVHGTDDPSQGSENLDSGSQGLKPQVVATFTGTLARWLVDDGTDVIAGEPVVVIEAMKMETQIEAPVSGTIRIVKHGGDAVRSGDVLGKINKSQPPQSQQK